MSFYLCRSGGPIELDNGNTLLPMPPVAVVLDQRMIQKTSSVDGDRKKQSFLDRDLFAVSCSVTDDAVTLFGFEVTVQMESPASRKCSCHTKSFAILVYVLKSIPHSSLFDSPYSARSATSPIEIASGTKGRQHR